ncbi:hypothetical protein OKW35_004463 [Paraburkholderia sp. MM5477-R1]
MSGRTQVVVDLGNWGDCHACREVVAHAGLVAPERARTVCGLSERLSGEP